MELKNNNNAETQLFELQSIINFFKKYWLIIGASIFIALVIAYGVNKFSQRKYLVSSSIVINEENAGMANASAQMMKEIGFISNIKNFANELVILKSTPLVKSALENLDFQISYFEKKLFYKKELYKSSPFIVILDKNYPQPIGVDFEIEIIDKEKYIIRANKKEVMIHSFVSNKAVEEYPVFELEKEVKFDVFLFSDIMKFKLLLNSTLDIEDLKGKTFSFRINTEGALVGAYKGSIEIIPPDLESSIAEIRLETYNVEKAKDFLNNLCQQYIKNELDRKRHSSIITIQYINDQLSIVGDSLERAERSLQYFRSQNEVADLSLQSGQFFEEMRELENKKAIMEVNQKYYDYVNEYFNKNEELEKLIAPSAMGIEDPMLNNLIEELIRLNAERASFIENNQAKSPYLKKINIRIENIRKMVSENIAYYRQTNSIALTDIDSRIKKLDIEMRKLPSTQRILVGIERKFNINDGIYTYLLEKRAEAEIAKASYQPDSEIVEPAQLASYKPIKPNKKVNYFLAFVLGFMIPVVILQMLEMIKSTFSDLNEMERVVALPVLGKIYNNEKKVDDVVNKEPNSYLAENFRHLRVGLKYFLQNEDCKTILFSSAISGEGKSFISKNTAHVIANADNKVIFLNFDLRKPYYDDHTPTDVLGMTEYLSNQASMEEIIKKSQYLNVDIVYPGAKAPNPAELISSAKVDRLFTFLKTRYDYIIVDTPPIGLLTDAYILADYSDLNVFVVRRNKTPKAAYSLIQEEILKRKLKSCVVYNDLPLTHKKKYGSHYYS